VALKSAALEVFVNEGKVKVEEKSRAGATVAPLADVSPALEAGHKIVVDLKPVPITQPMARVAPVPPAEAEQILAWQARMLDFDDRPLREIIADFNRYNQHQLILEDESLGRRTFGGTFRADDYAALVELLQRQFGVIAERSGQQTTLRVQSPR
jgi:transmembrane sensor